MAYQNVEETTAYTVLPKSIPLIAIAESTKCHFPVMVRTCTIVRSTPPFLLPRDTDIFLEQTATVTFARIRVLKNLRRQEDVGFMAGSEYLIPVNFPRKLKFVARTGINTKYGNVVQIIENPPTYVRVNEDLMSVPPTNTAGTRGLVIANTELEVTKTVCQDHEHKTGYIECKDNKTQKLYSFSDRTKVNFTEVPDRRLHTLKGIMDGKYPLPKTVKYLDVDPKDIVHLDDHIASNVLGVVSDPFQIMQFVQRKVMIGWIKLDTLSKTEQKYKVLLIPSGVWKKEMVSLLSFKTANGKSIYVDHRFPDCEGLQLIERNLYFIDAQERDLTILTKVIDCIDKLEPVLEEEELSDYEIPVDKPKSPAIHHPTDYEIPPEDAKPPVPPRRAATRKGSSVPEYVTSDVPLPTTKVHEKTDLATIISEKAKLGFDKVHKELFQRALKMFQKKPKEPPPVPNRPESSQKLYKRDFTLKPIPKTTSSKHDKNTVENVHSTTSDETKQDGIYRREGKSLYYDRTLPETPSLETGESHSDDDSEPPHAYDYPDFTKLQENPITAKRVAGYSSVTAIDVDRIARQHQTSEDFYKYTVAELALCFKICALEKLENVCAEKLIDGGLFKTFESSVFKKEPFCLNDFDIMKVNRIIQGWRPT